MPAQPTPGQPGPRHARVVLSGVLVAFTVLITAAVTAIWLTRGGTDPDNGAAIGSSASDTTPPSATPTEPTPSLTIDSAVPSGEPLLPGPDPARLSAAELRGDWVYPFTSPPLTARQVSGEDLTTCAALDAKGLLAALGCEYAVTLSYLAEGGQLQITHLVLAFTDPATPQRIIDEDLLTDTDLVVTDTLPDAVLGRWKMSAAGRYLVWTAVTAEQGVGRAEADVFLVKSNATLSDVLTRR